MPSLQERRLLRDLRLPEDADLTLRVTPTGDLQTVAGRENVFMALRNRALTVPGSLTHRGQYGGGLPLYIEAPRSPATKSRLANDLRRNLLRDRRLSDATVTVSDGVPSDTTRAHSITIGMGVRLRDETETEQITILLTE